jgi:hypothetical protein
METRTKRKWTRKAGGQVPRHVLRLMAQMHPTVEILWHTHHNRWCLVQNVRGQQVLIRVLGGKVFESPTIANTVHFLNAAHPCHFSSKWDQERLFNQMDEAKEAVAIKRRSRDQIREGSKDLFNALNNRVVIARP